MIYESQLVLIGYEVHLFMNLVIMNNTYSMLDSIKGNTDYNQLTKEIIIQNKTNNFITMQ